MNYTFKLKDGTTLSVFWNRLFKDEVNKTHGTVSWWVHENPNKPGKEYVRTVRIADDGRRFFTWNKEVIYMDNFLSYTPYEIVSRLKSSQRVTPDELCGTLKKYGLGCLKVKKYVKPLEHIDFGDFSIGFEVHHSNENDKDKVWIDYEFVEDRHDIESCYKLTLEPVGENKGIYPSRDYYVSDLVGLLSRCTDDFKIEVGK